MNLVKTAQNVSSGREASLEEQNHDDAFLQFPL